MARVSSSAIIILAVLELTFAPGSATAAPTKWQATHQPGATGTYTEYVNATSPANGGDRSGGSGGYGDILGDTFGNYIDFFDDTDTIEFDDVVVDLSGMEGLAIESRASDRFHRVTIDFFDSVLGVGSPTLGTFTVDRWRTTSWQNGQTVFTPGFDMPNGTYDIRITSVMDAQGDGDSGANNEGSHFFGLGEYVVPHVLTSSPSGEVNVLEFDDAWHNGGNPQANTTRDANATGNEWMDSVGGTGDYVDFEMFNPNGDATFDFSVRYRSGQGAGNVAVGTLYSILSDGEPVELATVDLPPTSGGWSGPFIDSTASASFALPEGYGTLRFQEIGNGFNGITHQDFLILTAVAPGTPDAGVLLAYEPFEGYADGNLPGQPYMASGFEAGGTWTGDSPGDTTVSSSGGLSYPGLPTTGGMATTAGDGGGGTWAAPDLSPGGVFDQAGLLGSDGKIGGAEVEGTLYYSFLAQSNRDFNQDPNAGSAFAAFQIYDGGSEGFGVGDNWGAWAFSVYQDGPDADLNSSDREPGEIYEYVDNDTHLFVVRVDYHANADDDVTVWFDPDPTLGEADQSPSLRTLFPGRGDLSFTNLRLRSGNSNNSWSYDEVRFGTSWQSALGAQAAAIPEPSTFALAALGLVGLGFVGWRRRRK